MKNKTIKFNLLENAKDSLSHAVEHLTDKQEPSPGDYKRVIVDIAHVIELILKERLRRVHPAFIFNKIDKYPALDAHTVTTGKAISRLKTIAEIDLDASSIKTIKACKKYRNLIEHYEFEIESKEARAIIGRLLSFIFDFSKIHLNEDLENEFRNDDRWQGLRYVHDFWQEHGQRWEQRVLDEKRDVMACPACGMLTFDIQQMECAFCEHIDALIECSVCKEMVLESDIESYEVIEGDEETGAYSMTIDICHNCIEKEIAAEAASESIREEAR